MPEARHRRATDREADIAAIDALIDRLVPALTARLASTHLGELEIREGEWRIRLRRPAGSGGWDGEPRRASDRASDRGSRGPGHEGHGHPRGTVEAHRVALAGGSNGSGPSAGSDRASADRTSAADRASGGDRASAGDRAPAATRGDETRRIATSPAVGMFRPGSRAAVGARVREGDSLGQVDVLGVPEEVRSPADGVVGELLVESGTAVEYGQELVVVALMAPAEAVR